MMTGEGWFTREIKGRHVLLVLSAFFGIMFIVNGIFVYFAIATFSGGDTSNPYQKGLHYNDELQADERQAERGWRTDVAYDGRAGQLRVSLLDKAAAPLSGLHVAVQLSRPATSKDDRYIRLTEVSPGVYEADVGLAPGLWVIDMASREADEGRESAYRLKQRLYVPEQPGERP
jgi:nitrogen fixation protein FixH